MWNNYDGGRYEMHVCNYNSWYEIVNQPHPGDNGVQAYPNVHKDYDDEPLANIQSADFAGMGPRCAGCIYDVAFDIWINNGFDNELMIWTENWGQRPAGNQVGTTIIGGHTFQVWKSGGASSPGGIFTYVAVPSWPSGTMPLQAFFQDVQHRGWIPANSTTWQVDFGVETVSTESNPERFDFTNFAIHD